LPCRYNTTPEHRIAVELVEADLEIGFQLIELAASDRANAKRILKDAEDVYQDILSRVAKFEPADRESFGPLVSELRREINLGYSDL